MTFSPQILIANLISWGRMVTHLACIVHRFMSLGRHIIYTSVASCNASTAATCMKWSPWSCSIISFTSHRKGIFGIKSSMDFWNFLIFCSAMVPSLNLFLWPIFSIILDFIHSNCFIPILEVFPFSWFFTTHFGWYWLA